MSNAVPDFADPVDKIGDLAASAGIRRVHVLGWRDLDDDEAGGSEVHIHEVARRWAAAGVEVTMRTSHARGRPAEATRDGYKVIRRAGRYGVFPRAAVAEALRRTGPRDVLVEIWNGMPFLSPVWCRGPRVIFLHHVHAEMWHMTLGQRLGQLGALFESKVAPPLYRRSAVATLSRSSRDELVDDLGFPAERVTVVHPGIDDRYTPGGAKADGPLVVAVGRLVPVKRYPLLIRAAHHARATVPDLRLDIVGDGYERPAVEALVAELGAGDWVTLRGSVDEDDKIDLYRRAWLVASASAREGWGMTLTEAAACGTPAVATRIAGHADAVQEGRSGLLADGDPASLGDAMAEVLGDAARRAALSRGALDWAAELTWNNTATELMRVVAGEVARRRTPG
ncbi:MAG TPA: glycosyltransferase family 4 protein [Acidimicrobiales bacterium]|nr:glycosyltransferase family 4 protein [Acidimicrobiales bacterium]